MIKKFFSLFLLLFVAEMYAACTAQTATTPMPTARPEYPFLKLVLQFDKDMYQVDEPISAQLTLLNDDNQEIVINKRMICNFLGAPDAVREVAFRIFSLSSNDELPFALKINVGWPELEDFIILLPGKTVSEEYELKRNYMNFSVPGDYVITAIYKNMYDPGDGREAWKGMLLSNMVRITLVP